MLLSYFDFMHTVSCILETLEIINWHHYPTSGKFITKFNVLRCISLSETLFWTGANGRIPITLIENK